MVQEDTPDCTERCRSTQHGNIITAAISRRSVSDFDLCSYLNHICKCCESVKDSVGRTALHVAASCGRIDLVRWLIQNRNANINIKDDESGFTALHRSIFYGKLNVAAELIKLGANPSLLDSNSLTVLDHAMLDGLVPEMNCGEVFVWGSNCNNSLGPQQSRSVSESLDVFHKKYADELVRKVVVEKFHSVIVTSVGKVYSCGHGQGGRLGLGNQRTVVIPEIVSFLTNSHTEPVTCIDVAISRDHSLFLCSDGNLYACGLNTHRVLGLSGPLSGPPQQVLIPTQVRHLPGDVRQVCTGQFHSVAWGPQCLYTWGLNAGQLGHTMRTGDKYVTIPKTVRFFNFSETEIAALDSSDGAISIYTKKGDIYVLHEYQCRKIASRQLNVVQVSIVGGKLNTGLSKEVSNEVSKELKIVALTNTGNLLLWQESDSQLCRCVFSLNRLIVIRQVKINATGLLFVTAHGEAFQGLIKPRKKKTTTNNEKSAFHKFLDRDDCISVKVSKFPRIHRAVWITSDVKDHDYCVIQVPPYKRFGAPQIVESEMRHNLAVLLEECQMNDDLHDVVFQVDHRYFPAHRYIVASRSSYFQKLFMDDNELIDLKGCHPLIFEQFLMYVYVGDCELLKCGECSDKFKSLCEKTKEPSNENVELVDGSVTAFQIYKDNKLSQKQEVSQNRSKNPVRMLHEMAKKFGCSDLCSVLSNYEMQKFVIRKKSKKEVNRVHHFDQMALCDFYDVTVRCADGKEVRAHKCILAAQSDYFSNLFSTRWKGTETTTITLACSKSIVEALLEYIYTDTLSYFNNKEQDHLFKLLVLADQLFINRLKEQCEYLLFQCLTLKNCVQFLSFASIYNAEKLKYCSLKFIVSNIVPLLELRMFNEMDDALLKELSDFYFDEKSEICCRVITPYSTAPPEEEIKSISSVYPISVIEQIEKVVQKSTQKRRVRTHKTNIEVSQKSLKENICDDNIIQFPDSPPDVTCDINTVIPSRLRAIKGAEEKIENEEVQQQFTKLVSKFSENSELLDSSFGEFPLLNSPPSSRLHSRSPHKIDTKHKIVKMSQKQKKRLSSENNSDITLPVSESPKNPWKIVSDFACTTSLETRMTDIISSEKKQKDNLIKIKSKLLIYTQIEDRAIEDLSKFYNIENVMDEDIIVERVNIGAVAAPVWVPGVTKLE